MKAYLQLLKYDLQKYGIKFIIPVILIVLITLYKFLYVGMGNKLLEITEPAIDIPLILLFTMIQIVVPLSIIWQLKGILKSNMFLTVPDIRNKIILYKGSLISLFFIWSILVLGIMEWKFIVLYSFVFIWYLSLLLVILWGFKYIYNSKKYLLLKIAFQFGILWAPYLTSVFKEFRTPIIIGYLLLIVFIHFRNFINHFTNYKEIESTEKKGIRYYLEGDFGSVFGSEGKEKSIKKLLKKISTNPSRFDYIKLYQFSLYKYTGNIILFIVVWFVSSFIIPFLYNLTGFITGAILIGLIILMIAIQVSKAFKKNDILENIFLKTVRKRKDFVKDILHTVFWYYSRLMFFVLFFVGFYSWRIFFKVQSEFNPLLHIVLPIMCFLVGFAIIYLKWKQNFNQSIVSAK